MWLFEGIRRIVLYVVSRVTNFYVIAFFAAFHVYIFGVPVENVVLPAMQRLGLHPEQLATSTDDPFALYDLKGPSQYDPHQFDSPPQDDPHQFDPLDWDKLRRMIS